jgi:putative acetyltransferase
VPSAAELHIRDARDSDRVAIGRLLRGAFGQDGETRLVEALRADGNVFAELVAVDGSAIAGHVLLSRMRAPFRALGLAPLAVASARQRQGIGAMLMGAAIERARAAKWEGIFLLGAPAYYARFGFRADAARAFASPYAGSHFMLLPLVSPLPAASGAVEYPAAFSLL